MFDERESEKDELAPELALLERQLAGLVLMPARIDRDRLMFEAGRAAERSSRPSPNVHSFWPVATAMTTAACVVLGAMLIWRSDAATVAQSADELPSNRSTLAVAPTQNDLRETEKLVARGGMSIWGTRPVGGYLEKRYIALTRGVGHLQSEEQFESDPSDSGNLNGTPRPFTARELIHEFVPARELTGRLSS